MISSVLMVVRYIIVLLTSFVLQADIYVYVCVKIHYSTPVHQIFSMGTPKRLDTTIYEEIALVPSPNLLQQKRKKNLAEIVKNSLRSDWDVDENIPGNENNANRKMEGKAITALDLPPKSASGTSFLCGANSVCSCERTTSGDFKYEEKSVRSAPCCLLRLRSSRSFSERKKKMSPTQSIG